MQGDAEGAGDAEYAEVHTYEKGTRARTYGEYAEETLAGCTPPKGPPANAGPKGSATQLTYQDAAIRAQQIITKAALRFPDSNAMDIIY